MAIGADIGFADIVTPDHDDVGLALGLHRCREPDRSKGDTDHGDARRKPHVDGFDMLVHRVHLLFGFQKK